MKLQVKTILVALIVSFFCSCQSKKELAEAKTTQEALESISNMDYQLVKQTLNKKEVPITQAISWKFINQGLKENSNALEDAFNGFTGTPGVASIITNMKGFENSDEQKPYYYNIEYFNEQSQKHIKFKGFGANITGHGDSLKLGFQDSNMNRRVYYFKKQP